MEMSFRGKTGFASLPEDWEEECSKQDERKISILYGIL